MEIFSICKTFLGKKPSNEECLVLSIDFKLVLSHMTRNDYTSQRHNYVNNPFEFSRTDFFKRLQSSQEVLRR